MYGVVLGGREALLEAHISWEHSNRKRHGRLEGVEE